ncbi:MAG TPA: G8 domain-containing protein, partial [Gemmatimonadales bacterium]|nr:G8 domain-containing protein [Gemmatimonadales bacterium]
MRLGLRRSGVAVVLGLFTACAAPDSNGPDGGGPSGNALAWSAPESWPGNHVPAAGDSVVIPAGATIKLDVSPPALHSLTIEGTLVFGNVDLALTSGWILVRGALKIGSEANPFTKRALITLTGTGAANDPSVDGMGNKMLGVSGSVEIHGQRRGGWTRLRNTAVQGATQISLVDNPGWKVGDRLALASSDYSQDKFEEAEITGVSGTTLTLAAPLKYEHYGEIVSVSGTSVDERAEVGLLTRNITIQGDTGTTPGYGGHIIIMAGAVAHIEGVELFRMGQRG